MICYASRTGTKRNLRALKSAGWRLLISRSGVWRTEGFPYALDNGAWTDFKAGIPSVWDRYRDLLDRLGKGADWCVAPDIVKGGHASLRLSVEWLDFCLERCAVVLIAVQDGMTPDDLAHLVGMRVGIFLGGSTEWKLANMALWGRFCRLRGVHYHVARVNTVGRIKESLACGASSIDGSSASRYALSLPMLDVMTKQRDLFL